MTAGLSLSKLAKITATLYLNQTEVVVNGGHREFIEDSQFAVVCYLERV